MNLTNNHSRSSSLTNNGRNFLQEMKHLDSYNAFLIPSINAKQAHAKNLEAEDYVRKNLQLARKKPCDLPDDPSELGRWMDAHIEKTGGLYKSYLIDRKNGAPRKYFPTKAHALLFIQCVSPTKKVDGAWLYGTLHYWNDPRFHPLIHTYLDEIGNGISVQNHVVIFEKLMKEEGMNSDQSLPDPYYQQGAIQLALGYATPSYLPEVIGFNLGYEVMPLHLLISTYELRELGIDPFYFSLHLTIDNAACGHARQALSTIESLLPSEGGERALFYERLKDGYRLNDLGVTSTEIISSINLEHSVQDILHHKAKYGQYAHSDYCRHGGKTVNEWLSDVNEIPKFTEVLKNKGWIKIDEDPSLSRFWHLIHGDEALMFGVFTPAEQQIIYDWIAGNWQSERTDQFTSPNLFKARTSQVIPKNGFKNQSMNDIRDSRAGSYHSLIDDLQETDHFLPCWLKQAFESSISRTHSFKLLISYLCTPIHTRPIGLLAARKYCRLLLEN